MGQLLRGNGHAFQPQFLHRTIQFQGIPVTRPRGSHVAVLRQNGSKIGVSIVRLRVPDVGGGWRGFDGKLWDLS